MNLDFMSLKYDTITSTAKLNGWIVSHWIRLGITIVLGFFSIKAFKINNKLIMVMDNFTITNLQAMTGTIAII